MYRIKGKRESFYHQPESDEEFKYLLHCVSGIKTESPDPLILFRIQHELGNSRATNYVIPTLAHILFAMVLYGFPVQLSSPALTRPIWQMALHYLYNHHRCNCLRIKTSVFPCSKNIFISSTTISGHSISSRPQRPTDTPSLYNHSVTTLRYAVQSNHSGGC